MALIGLDGKPLGKHEWNPNTEEVQRAITLVSASLNENKISYMEGLVALFIMARHGIADLKGKKILPHDLDFDFYMNAVADFITEPPATEKSNGTEIQKDN